MRLDFNLAMAQSFPLLERAENLLQARWKAKPDDWMVGWKLAQTLRQLGRLSQASACYSQVLRLNPECKEAEYINRILEGKCISHSVDFDINPVPFRLKSKFFTKKQLELVWKTVLGNKDKFTQSPLSTGVDLMYRRSKVVFDDQLDDLKTLVFGRVHDLLDQSWNKLGVEPFEATREEIQLTRHSGGEFYHTHCDCGNDVTGRTITFVIYLFHEPSQFKGGDLIMYDWDSHRSGYSSKFTRIIPENNSVLLFPSNGWHQVTPVIATKLKFGMGRFTLNGWFHKSIPEADGNKDRTK